MRYFAFLASIYAATLGTSHGLYLVDARERTTVEVAASGYDERTSYPGCSPDGCIPENTRDGSRSGNSRWSCKGDILDNDDEGCWIEYYFDEPQDIVELQLAFYKGTETTRTLNVYNNGDFRRKFDSNGESNGFQTFYLGTDETSKLRIYLDDWESNPDLWLSITEVMFMVR